MTTITDVKHILDATGLFSKIATNEDGNVTAVTKDAEFMVEVRRIPSGILIPTARSWNPVYGWELKAETARPPKANTRYWLRSESIRLTANMRADELRARAETAYKSVARETAGWQAAADRFRLTNESTGRTIDMYLTDAPGLLLIDNDGRSESVNPHNGRLPDVTDIEQYELRRVWYRMIRREQATFTFL